MCFTNRTINNFNKPFLYIFRIHSPSQPSAVTTSTPITIHDLWVVVENERRSAAAFSADGKPHVAAVAR